MLHRNCHNRIHTFICYLWHIADNANESALNHPDVLNAR